MITKLIRTLTNRETSRRDRTAPRRALKPTLDGLEARVALNGGWTTPTTYTPPPTSPGTITEPMPWIGTLTPQVVTPPSP
jgi:hypothetical protein